MSRSVKLINEMLAYTGDKLGRNIDSNTLADLLLDEKIGGLIVGGAFERLKDAQIQPDLLPILSKQDLLQIFTNLGITSKGIKSSSKHVLVKILRNNIYGKYNWFDYYENENLKKDNDEEEEEEDDEDELPDDVKEEQAIDRAFEILDLQELRQSNKFNFKNLKKRFLKLLVKNHPDKHPDERAKYKRKSKKIIYAFNLLKDTYFPDEEDDDEEEEDADDEEDEDNEEDEDALDKAFEFMGLQDKRKDLDFSTLKKTYFKLSKIYHPDKNKGQEAKYTELFKTLGNAYHLIANKLFPEAGAGFFGGKLPKKFTFAEAMALFKRTFPKAKL